MPNKTVSYESDELKKLAAMEAMEDSEALKAIAEGYTVKQIVQALRDKERSRLAHKVYYLNNQELLRRAREILKAKGQS